MYKYIITVFICFTLQACCTEKKCTCEVSPYITFNISGFSVSDKSNFYAIRTVPNSSFIIDSVQFAYNPDTSGQIYLSLSCTQEHCGGVYSYIIVNRPAGFSDTISQIVTVDNSYTFKCNECILAKDLQSCPEQKVVSITAHDKTYTLNNFSYTLVKK